MIQTKGTAYTFKRQKKELNSNFFKLKWALSALEKADYMRDYTRLAHVKDGKVICTDGKILIAVDNVYDLPDGSYLPVSISNNDIVLTEYFSIQTFPDFKNIIESDGYTYLGNLNLRKYYVTTDLAYMYYKKFGTKKAFYVNDDYVRKVFAYNSLFEISMTDDIEKPIKIECEKGMAFIMRLRG